MIILDTNVISEAMRGPAANPAVLAWIRSLRARPVTTALNRAEILAGIAILPDGPRKERLRAAAESAFGGIGVCLPLIADCASEYAQIVATRRAAGHPIGTFDALVAAVARVSSAAIATRDVADFDSLGLELIDPWTVGG